MRTRLCYAFWEHISLSATSESSGCGDLRVPNQSEHSAARRRLRGPQQPQTSKIFLHMWSPALVSLPGPAGTVRGERGRAPESDGAPSRGSGGEEEAAVVVGALVGVGERGVGRVDADEVLGGGGGGGVLRGGGVRVHGERQAAVRGLDLPARRAGAQAQHLVQRGGSGAAPPHRRRRRGAPDLDPAGLGLGLGLDGGRAAEQERRAPDGSLRRRHPQRRRDHQTEGRRIQRSEDTGMRRRGHRWLRRWRPRVL